MIKSIQASTGSAPPDKRQSSGVQDESNDLSSQPINDSHKAALSHEVTHLSTDNLSQKLSEQSEIDEEKVTVIKQAIANGEYPLDSQKIAQAFLSLESILN